MTAKRAGAAKIGPPKVGFASGAKTPAGKRGPVVILALTPGPGPVKRTAANRGKRK